MGGRQKDRVHRAMIELGILMGDLSRRIDMKFSAVCSAVKKKRENSERSRLSSD